MTRNECLNAAIDAVCKDRQNTYGPPEDNFKLIADLWSTYTGVKISPRDVAVMMILLKVARVRTGTNHGDNFVDIAGYAACACELRFPDFGKTCKELTEGELIDRYGVDKETNEPMRCDEIGGCRKCLFAKDSNCYDSMREWIENHFTDAGKMVGTDTNVGTKKPKFRLEDYKGRCVMHCDTEEKAKIFCRYLHENGCNWASGDFYIRNTCFYNYKEKTCYEFNNGLWESIEYYKENGFLVLEFDDFDWSEYGEVK